MLSNRNVLKSLALFSVFVIAALFFSSPLIADEGDILPDDQKAVFITAPDVNEMHLIVPEEPVDPTVNWDSHFLNNDNGRELSGISFITPKSVVIKLFSGISVVDFVRVHDDLRKIEDYTDLKDVTLVINSPGGSAFEGLSIASLILKYRAKGYNIKAEGFGIIASAAVPILSVCSPRHVAPGTLIMVHEAALWKWPGRETASDIDSQQDLMTMLSNRYTQFLIDHSTTSKEDWDAMIKDTTWMTPEMALGLGLVDEVK